MKLKKKNLESSEKRQVIFERIQMSLIAISRDQKGSLRGRRDRLGGSWVCSAFVRSVAAQWCKDVFIHFLTEDLKVFKCPFQGLFIKPEKGPFGDFRQSPLIHIALVAGLDFCIDRFTD